ncbi:MAG TPA: hypothetical protein ENJ31_08285 [Anaerolineae bacterium]|nr:hypothetical protein [Anaerolineae bacterium]
MEELSTQIGLALEYARLLDETRRRADREQLLSEVTARMREVLDMDTVLRTAAREIEQRLGLYDVTIRLESENATD